MESLAVKNKSRSRSLFFILGGFIALLLDLLIDPDAALIQNLPFGASTLVYISTILKATWALALLHMGRKTLINYVDLQETMKKALRSPEGAGMVAVTVGLLYIAIAIVIYAVFTTL